MDPAHEYKQKIPGDFSEFRHLYAKHTQYTNTLRKVRQYINLNFNYNTIIKDFQ